MNKKYSSFSQIKYTAVYLYLNYFRALSSLQLQIEGYDDTQKGVYYFSPKDDSLEEVKNQLKLNLDAYGQSAQSEIDTKKNDLSMGE